jgi:hypothetical protein
MSRHRLRTTGIWTDTSWTPRQAAAALKARSSFTSAVSAWRVSSLRTAEYPYLSEVTALLQPDARIAW